MTNKYVIVFYIDDLNFVQFYLLEVGTHTYTKSCTAESKHILIIGDE